jgi:cytochrome c-type biogenesis protein CcmH/NrfF
MLAAGIQTPVPLAELGSHLREEVEERMRSGCNEQQAFTLSVARIGEAARLKQEFRKVP